MRKHCTLVSGYDTVYFSSHLTSSPSGATTQQETWTSWTPLPPCRPPPLYPVKLSLRASADGPAPLATPPPLHQQSTHQCSHQLTHHRTPPLLPSPSSYDTTPSAPTLHTRASKKSVWFLFVCVFSYRRNTVLDPSISTSFPVSHITTCSHMLILCSTQEVCLRYYVRI